MSARVYDLVARIVAKREKEAPALSEARMKALHEQILCEGKPFRHQLELFSEDQVLPPRPR